MAAMASIKNQAYVVALLPVFWQPQSVDNMRPLHESHVALMQRSQYNLLVE